MNRDELIQSLKGRKIDDNTYDRIYGSYPISDICPTCGGQGDYILAGTIVDCDCELQMLLQKHYFAANIGREYHDICFKDFIGPNRELVVPVCEKYLDEFDDNSHYGLGLTISGSIGVGKTFSMTSVLKELIKRGVDCYFISFEEMINTWASSWHDDLAKKTLQDRLKRAHVLGIDEVKSDARNLKGFLSQGFDSVIRHRTSNLLPTLVTTNLSASQERAEFGKVFSLLSARNERIQMNGADLRTTEIRQTVYGLRNAGERRPIC